MAAAVCGNKRSFFEDVPSSPPVSKRIRCGSASPMPQPTPLLDRLRTLFPQLEPQFLERALEDCNDDLDSTINKLNELCSRSEEEKLGFKEELGANLTAGGITVQEIAATSDLLSSPSKVPENGAEWVDLLVAEMMNAINMDDAKARVSRVLKILEKSTMARMADDAAQNFQKENMMLREQIETLLRENSILKRAVAIQHERQKEFENRNQELQHLRQLVNQYQEQVRTLEVNNYTLLMHLREAQQSSSIPGRFHPDVF